MRLARDVHEAVPVGVGRQGLVHVLGRSPRRCRSGGRPRSSCRATRRTPPRGEAGPAARPSAGDRRPCPPPPRYRVPGSPPPGPPWPPARRRAPAGRGRRGRGMALLSSSAALISTIASTAPIRAPASTRNHRAPRRRSALLGLGLGRRRDRRSGRGGGSVRRAAEASSTGGRRLVAGGAAAGAAGGSGSTGRGRSLDLRGVLRGLGRRVEFRRPLLVGQRSQLTRATWRASSSSWIPRSQASLSSAASRRGATSSGCKRSTAAITSSLTRRRIERSSSALCSGSAFRSDLPIS